MFSDTQEEMNFKMQLAMKLMETNRQEDFAKSVQVSTRSPVFRESADYAFSVCWGQSALVSPWFHVLKAPHHLADQHMILLPLLTERRRQMDLRCSG